MPGLEVAGGHFLMEGAILLAKATLAMVGALAISRTLLRRDPTARHALWTGTMLVLLALPLLSVAGTPGVVVPVPFIPASSGGGNGEVTLAPPSLGEASSGTPFADPISPPRGFRGVSPGEFDAIPPGALAVSPSDPLGEAHPVEDRAAAEAPSVPGSWTGSVASGVGLLWGGGVAVLLMGLMVGVGRAWCLIRGARPLSGPDWVAQAKSTARRVGLRQPVPLRVARGLGSPMAGGVLRPVVLLPPEAEGWTGERREVVLLHELVHVRRRDPLRQLLDRVVVALYWFHPLVRRAASEAATAREEACDRRVVELGTGPSRYASHLVELTDRPSRALVGLTGFHHPNLEERIMSILAPSRPSRRGASLLSALLALSWFGVVMVATPVASQTPPPVPPAPVQTDSPTPPSPPTAPVGTPGVPVAPPATPDPVPEDAATLLGQALRGQACRESAGDEDGMRLLVRGSDAEGGPRTLRVARLGPYTVCYASGGEVRLAEGGIRPSSMPPGSSLDLEVASQDGRQQLRIQVDDDGALHEEWRVDGLEQPLGPQVEAWRGALLEYLGASAERGDLTGAEARLRGEIARMNGERARLEGEIARARGAVARLAGERSRLAGQEARLRGETARLHGETARLRGQLHRTDDPEERRALEERIEAHSADVERRSAEIDAEIEALDTPTRLAEMQEEIEVMRAETDREADAVRARIDILETEHEARTREIEAEIEALDVEARVAEIDARLPELRARAIAAIEAIGFIDGGTP